VELAGHRADELVEPALDGGVDVLIGGQRLKLARGRLRADSSSPAMI